MATDPYRYFRIEARELVEQLGAGVLEIERAGAGAALVGKLLRLAHTLKGAARIVKHATLAQLAHALEDALEPLRDGRTGAMRHDAALALVDRMSEQVAQLPDPAAVAAGAVPAPASASGSGSAPASASAPGSASALASGSGSGSASGSASASGSGSVAGSVAASGSVAGSGSVAVGAPRIDAAALDELIAGLAEVQSQLARARLAADPVTLVQRLDHAERELAQARQDADRLRLLPVGAVFAALERTARDATGTGGTRVELAATGGDIRVDAQIVSAVHGALVQLVRNALAHGIEPPAARAAAGKPPIAMIRLDVVLRGQTVAFTLSDDGRGIDVPAVRAAAARRGIPIGPSDDDVLDVLLGGGLTTAPAVTTAAGRGIGLDVVRAAATELGGHVTARSVPGRGAAFTLAVPVALAALSALMVEAGGRVAAIPVDAVRRVIRVAPGDLTRGDTGLALAYDDTSLPLASLARILGGSEAATPIATAAIIEAEHALVAIGIDRPHGAEELTLRAVPAGAPVAPVVWGFALDRDGVPRPVLDPAQLVRAARSLHAPTAAVPAAALSILVVDDSLTTRMLEQSILESAGYDVDVAISAEDALVKLAGRRYALMLVDVEMPGMTGFELVAQLRARPATAALPAILVSSRDAPEDLQRGTAVGAQGYMIKSEFDQVALLALIEKLTT